ncbi:transmembrane protease serine 11F-like [Cydia amplana]|uniref:transmembrane protease serine 11F-like n=1 Tax=Cydia amplana TaxID=1869771 RepID=UPI002FE5232B
MWQTVILVVLCYCVEGRRQSRQPLRVHQGMADVHNEFSFAVSLQNYQGERCCTASLIALNWVLTAAHCIDDEQYVVRYTNFTIRKGSVRVAKVLKIILHPQYIQDSERYNDIAVIQTTYIYNKTIGRLSAIDYKSLTGLPVKYAGFGSTSEDSSDQEEDKFRPLQVGEAVVIRPYNDHEGPNVVIAPSCSNRRQGILGGDSGGPLIYDGRIVGVAMSLSNHDNIAHYAAVSTYLQWIHNTMKTHGYKLS